MAKADRNSNTNANIDVTDDKLTRAEIVRDVRILVPASREKDVEAALDVLTAEKTKRREREQHEAGWRDDMKQFLAALERVRRVGLCVRHRMPKPELLEPLEAECASWAAAFRKRLAYKDQPRRNIDDKRAAIGQASALLARYRLPADMTKRLLPKVAAVLYGDASTEESMRLYCRPHIAAAVGATRLTHFNFRRRPGRGSGISH